MLVKREGTFVLFMPDSKVTMNSNGFTGRVFMSRNVYRGVQGPDLWRKLNTLERKYQQRLGILEPLPNVHSREYSNIYGKLLSMSAVG